MMDKLMDKLMDLMDKLMDLMDKWVDLMGSFKFAGVVQFWSAGTRRRVIMGFGACGSNSHHEGILGPHGSTRCHVWDAFSTSPS